MKIDEKIQNNVPLAEFTTFKIGGPARFFIVIETRDELVDIFNWIEEKKVKYVILSGCSNVLVSDDGFDGLAIMIKNNDAVVKGDRVDCGAGTNLGRVVTSTISNCLTNMEWAVGIPGSVGGAVRGNAGAFGESISENIETVEVYNTKDKKFETLSRRECEFAYRSSKFKTDTNYIVWRALLRFKKGILQETQKKISEYNNHRSGTQPNLPSAGCIFKNIILKDLDIENNLILKRMGIEEHAKGGKVGAGWLIDKADLRGKRIGGAKISLEHANFIVNTSNATADDVAILISFVKQKVREKFKIQLFEEVSYIGF